MKSLVSVIIPTFNMASFLSQAIQSVLNQTFSDFELIVIDDGSNDNTKSVVHSFNDVRIEYVYQENKGLSGARNTGLRLASGKYIAFLDADDLFLPDKLAVQSKYLEEHLEVGVVVGGFQRIDSEGNLIKETYFKPGQVSMEDLLVANRFIIHSTMIRRSCIEEIGGFDESLKGAEEWDFHSRLAISGCRMERTADIVCAYRMSNNSLSSDIGMQTEYRLKVVEKIFSNPLLPENLLALKNKSLGYTYLKAAIPYYCIGDVDKGKENLKLALQYDPALKQNNYKEIFSLLVFWVPTITKNQIRYIEDMFDNLPEEAQDMKNLKEKTLAKVHVNS